MVQRVGGRVAVIGGFSASPRHPIQRDSYQLPGLPIYHALAILGALAALFRPGPARRFQWAFVPTLFGTWFAVMLTAAVIPRHRFVLEPFWLVYLFFLLDGAVALIMGFARKNSLGRRRSTHRR